MALPPGVGKKSGAEAQACQGSTNPAGLAAAPAGSRVEGPQPLCRFTGREGPSAPPLRVQGSGPAGWVG